MFGCIFFCVSLWMHVSHPVSWLWNRKVRLRLTVSHCDVLLTMSSLLPEICLARTVGRVGYTCNTSSLDALLCSTLRKMRRWNTLIMDWWCLWVFLRFKIQPNMVFAQRLKRRYSFISGLLFKRVLIFQCNMPKQTKVLSKQQLALTKTMCGWKLRRATHRGCINIISSNLTLGECLLYTIYCCYSAQMRN